MSQTVHFAANWRKSTVTVPHCQRLSFRPRHGATTTNKGEVNCTRCAKQLDIAPAPKAVSSTRGTCQCCFGAYETRQKGSKGGWHVVLHGYKRPGHGYILGACRGQGYVPFEVSCEQTKVWCEELKGVLARRESYRSDLLNDKVPALVAKVDTGQRIRDARGLRTTEYKGVEVKLGQGETQNPFQPNCSWLKVPSYDTLRKNAVHNTELDIRAIKADIAFLTEKIETWKPVAFPLAK